MLDSFAMKALTDHTVRFWVLGACAVLLSAASAFTFLNYIGQGIAVGDLVGVAGHEADVAIAQRWAIFWLSASCACFVGSSVTAALASPIYPDAPRVAKFIARLVVSTTLLVDTDGANCVDICLNHCSFPSVGSSLTRSWR